MNLLKASAEIRRYTPDGLEAIEEAARTCYLSEPKDTQALRAEYKALGLESVPEDQFITYPDFVRDRFLRGLILKGHNTPFEYMDIEVEFIVDRGVSHEAVRHRLCSPMQESTRYCNYSEDGKHGMNVIEPVFFDATAPRDTWVDVDNIAHFGDVEFQDMELQLNKMDVWRYAMWAAEWSYNTLLKMGASPQEARTVLPNSLKTKLKIKANVREWWHIMSMRAVNPGAHPQMREVMLPLLKEFKHKWPMLFWHIN